ncbi:hypothetical protein NBRC110019_20730 [Neptunitalea chrysea]|uniref:Uncharacterized protein n=2 Tax=Neptunitalea chrysea TaxID=1647581 RepID=A0A9W6EWI7_9FLAO|nr:hypothetical protein NBRC110019_20730 [Neptunitalea chrysea]
MAPFEFFSAYLNYLALTASALFALITMLIPGLNGERYSRIFIVITFIVTPLVLLYKYFTTLVFFNVNLSNYVLTPLFYICLTTGVILLAGAIKFSRFHIYYHTDDGAVLLKLLGSFLIIRLITQLIEIAYFKTILPIPIWAIIIKLLSAGSMIYLGYLMRKLEFGLLWIIVGFIIFFMYGIV